MCLILEIMNSKTERGRPLGDGFRHLPTYPSHSAHGKPKLRMKQLALPDGYHPSISSAPCLRCDARSWKGLHWSSLFAPPTTLSRREESSFSTSRFVPGPHVWQQGLFLHSDLSYRLKDARSYPLITPLYFNRIILFVFLKSSKVIL